MPTLRTMILPALGAAALLAAGCGGSGDDDDAAATTPGAGTPTAPAATSTATTPAETAPAATTPAATTPTATTPTATTPTNTTPAPAGADPELARGEITVAATDFAFSPTRITTAPGRLNITLRNDGRAPHELVVLETDAAPDALEVSDGRVSEDDSVGEIAELDAGASGNETFTLRRGHYVFVCNLPGHYADGMRGEITVR